MGASEPAIPILAAVVAAAPEAAVGAWSFDHSPAALRTDRYAAFAAGADALPISAALSHHPSAKRARFVDVFADWIVAASVELAVRPFMRDEQSGLTRRAPDSR